MSNKSNTLPVGYLLRQYRLDAVLGAGGFGITYLGVHEALQIQVAIKEYFPVEWCYRDRNEINVLANSQGSLPDSKIGQPTYSYGLERFLYEARILARINHPDVVRVRDFFEANGTAYIVMDYEDGEPLSHRLHQETRLPEAEVFRLVDDLLPALEAVHTQGYLHRDLKPANLYRRTDGRTLLIDFGAARQELGRHSKSLISILSPGYSPIEQYLVGGKGHGPWSDIYALGAVFYHCVTGVVPVEAPARLLDDPLCPAEEAAAGRYSLALLRTIDQAMAARPEKRFQNVAQMRAALQVQQSDNDIGTVKLELPRHLRGSNEKLRNEGAAKELAATDASASESLGDSMRLFDPILLETVRWNLAVYLGPIARVLVRQAADKARTVCELLDLLAAHIPAPAERAAFLKSVSSAKPN